jgi:hypothetical protein
MPLVNGVPFGAVLLLEYVPLVSGVPLGAVATLLELTAALEAETPGLVPFGVGTERTPPLATPGFVPLDAGADGTALDAVDAAVGAVDGDVPTVDVTVGA